MDEWRIASVAYLTDERAIARVNSRVSQQMMLQRKAFLAFRTLIRPAGEKERKPLSIIMKRWRLTLCLPLRRVEQQMCVQAVLVSEVLPTVDANVRSFAWKVRKR